MTALPRLSVTMNGLTLTRVCRGGVLFVDIEGGEPRLAEIPLRQFEEVAVRFLEMLGRVKFEGEPRAKL